MLQVEVDVRPGKGIDANGFQAVTRIGGECRILGPFETGAQGEHVQLVRLKLCHHGVFIGQNLVDHLVELRPAEIEVRIGDHAHVLSAIPGHHLEWTAADRQRVIRSGIERAFVVVVLREQVRRKNRRVAVDAP